MEVTLQSFKKRFTYDPQKDLLGKGGFGEVYKAYDNEDHIYVALKISQGTADDKYNLVNEVKRFKKLNHPNIVKHIEAYEVNTGSTDIHGKPILYHVGILEYADKGTLADLLKNRNLEGFQNLRGFNDLIEDLAKDIIEGLAYLHKENIIHRDLKPTNILLFSEGAQLRAKITDFGIAKRADATAASTQLVGTVEYMAPEYFTTGNITPASDVWSLGVMLLESACGTHPFGKTSQGMGNEQIIANILNKDLTTATQNLTEPLKGIITRCLLRDVNLRPQSANELKGLLHQTGDAFAEKTQLISAKHKATVAEKSKSGWRRWGAALFDFDLSNGKWRKVLARECFLTLPFIPFFIHGIQVGEDLGYLTLASLPLLRITIALFIWSFKTLDLKFPSVSESTKKATKVFLLSLLGFSLLGSLIFFGIYQYNEFIGKKNTSKSDYSDASTSTKYLFITGTAKQHDGISRAYFGSQVLKIPDYTNDVVRYKIEDFATRKIEEQIGPVLMLLPVHNDTYEQALAKAKALKEGYQKAIEKSNSSDIEFINLNISQSEIDRLISNP